jgi:hypothetical protein
VCLPLVFATLACYSPQRSKHLNGKHNGTRQVQGTLSTLVDEKYVTYNFVFDLEIKQLRGSRGGVDDEAIARVSLARGSNMPDGSLYTARYSYRGREYESTGLRIEGGELLASF